MTDEPVPMARVDVDPEPCVSFGQCVAEHPEVFYHDDDGVSNVKPPGLLPLEEAIDVAQRCPVQAIFVHDERTGERAYPG